MKRTELKQQKLIFGEEEENLIHTEILSYFWSGLSGIWSTDNVIGQEKISFPLSVSKEFQKISGQSIEFQQLYSLRNIFV